jgi:hypothetical protein
MVFTAQKRRSGEGVDSRAARHSARPHWGRMIACIAGMAAITGAANLGQQTPSINPDRPYLLPAANRLPDVNDQMEMREQQQQTKPTDFAAANQERKKQISDDSARLLKLATELKTEVDKTTKDTLSLDVIRKADEIERLAHSVKEKMKLTAGGS